MRTRNADSSKAAAAKNTPPARKSASKSPANAKSPQTKRTSTIRTRQAKKNEDSPVQNVSVDEKPEQSSEEGKAVADASQVTPDTKVATAAKSTPKRTPGRPRNSNKAVSTGKQGDQMEAIDDETPKGDNFGVAEKLEEPQNVELVKADENESKKVGEQDVEFVGQSAGNEQQPIEGDEPVVESACELVEKERDILEVEVSVSKDAPASLNQEEPTMAELTKSPENEDSTGAEEGEQAKEENGDKASEKSMEEEANTFGHKEQFNTGAVNTEMKDQEVQAKEEDGEKSKEEEANNIGHKEQFNTGAINIEMKDQEVHAKEEDGEKSKEEEANNIGDKEQFNTGAVNMEMKDQEVQAKAEDGEKSSEKSKEEEANNIGHKEQFNTDSVDMEMQEQGEQAEEEDGEKASEKSMEEDGKKSLEKSTEEQTNNIVHNQESITDCVEMEMKDQSQQDDVKPDEENLSGDQGMQGCGEKLDFGDQGKEELVEDDPEEPLEETETLDEECRELTAIVKERKIKKEHEIFVGGLDRDATEEDLKKVFEKIGEVVEVRLHKNSSTGKNKGYAFVRFSCKEHAKKALLEMKNPVIRGKRCGTAPSEDNDTLFLGNICNTWTKEAIKQKLKDYGVEGVENITLVPDVQREGLSRGFAFLEFSCHADAMLAYKRLQKPDVIFGHAERTAKVAFAEPVREPDPEIMAQVKSVFVDGLPPHWDEDSIRDHFKNYGEIVKIVLARNMSTAKRKDFGFVDFSTHEAAVACVHGVNGSEFVDGTSKKKVRARLSNPLPKTQAIKGGMCGGFRTGHARTGFTARYGGRGFARGGHAFNRGSFNRDQNFFHGGRSQIGRLGFRNDLDFHQRQFGIRGERMGPFMGGHYAGGQGAAAGTGPSRPYLDRAWYGTPDRGPGEPIPPRMPFSPGQLDRPFMGRHFDDPYLYDDNVHGVKRPFYMTDSDPNYMGPVSIRPRLDYTDPAVFRGSHYHDPVGGGSRQYSRDYYGSSYGGVGGPYSSFYGGENSYGRGYYY